MNDTTDASAIFAPIWRRKWLVLAVAVLVGAGTYYYYKHKPKTFSSTTQLYLAAGSEEQQTEKGVGRTRVNAAAQAQLITTLVHETVRKALRERPDRTSRLAAKGKVRAKSGEKSEFITVTTEARNGKASSLLANSIARVYIARQHNHYERGLERTIAVARRQLKRLETPHATNRGSKSGAPSVGLSASAAIQAANLNSKINQLESQLNVKAVQQVNPAKPNKALLLGTSPSKNAIFGFVIGLVLSSIAVFVLSRFNRRLRTVAELEDAYGGAVLAVLPQVRTPVVERDGALAPARLLLEPMRQLDTALKLGLASINPDVRAGRSILFISAEPGEGKSAVAAGLALVEADGGARAAIVETNLRRPVLGAMLRLPSTKGLVDLLAGAAPLSALEQHIPGTAAPGAAAASPPDGDGGVATALATAVRGRVSVLVGATGAPNPQALLGSDTMAEVLRAVSEEHDVVLLDAPSPLQVSDAMPLMHRVDGIVIVARVGHLLDSSARRLRQLLDRTPSAPVLGVVANGVPRKEVRKYGAIPAKRGRLFGR